MKEFLSYFNRPRPAQVRGMLLIACLAAGLDWLLKYLHWWGSIPHQTDRSTEVLILFLLLSLLLLSLMPKRFVMVGCGLMLGGSLGNLIDLEIDGVVWDMIPLPDNIYANLADFFILSGILTLLIGLAIQFYKAVKQGFFVAPGAGPNLK